MNANGRDDTAQVQRGDNVLAGASLAFPVLAALAGFVLLYASARLAGYFEMPGAPREHESIGAAVVFCFSVFCFFEAVQFYGFFAHLKFETDIMRGIDRARSDELITKG